MAIDWVNEGAVFEEEAGEEKNIGRTPFGSRTSGIISGLNPN